MNFNIKLTNKAQSVIEYMIIIVLIMSATIVTGPYVIRSINAHFKSLDAAVYDTFHDPLKETGDTLDLDMPECNDISCEYVKPCIGEVCCGYGSCSATETSLMNKCNPQRCEPITWQCTPTPECCDKRKSTGICFNSLMYSSYGFHIENYSECSNSNSEIVKQTCGDNSDKYYCIESFNCTAKCTNFPGSAEGVCKDFVNEFPGDSEDEDGLFQNQDYVVVGRINDCLEEIGVPGSQACVDAGYTGCTRNTKCQALCPDNFVVNLEKNLCEKDICIDQIPISKTSFSYNLHPDHNSGEYYVNCLSSEKRETLYDGDVYTGCQLIVDSNGGDGWGEQMINYVFPEPINIKKVFYTGFKDGESDFCDPQGSYSNEVELKIDGVWIKTGLSICNNDNPDKELMTVSISNGTWEKVSAARLPLRVQVSQNGDYFWKGTEFHVENCTKRLGKWINSIAPFRCGPVCAANGMVEGTSTPEGMSCASGENRPCFSGPDIGYHWGTWGGCVGKSTTWSWNYNCQRPGQKDDGDGTDHVVACFCDYY